MSAEVEWRPVPGFEGVYAVSESGQIMRVAPGPRTRPGFIQKPSKHVNGYSIVRLFWQGKGKSHLVHRLVALAFHGEPEAGSNYACHIDGDATNNHYSNLRWATPRQNLADRFYHAEHGKGIPAPLS